MKKILFFFLFLSSFAAFNTAFAEIRVVMVKGEAALKIGRNWAPLAIGQVLFEGAVISTGANSYIKLKVDAHDMTVKPLTTIKIFKNQTANGKNVTNIGLKYGGVNAKVNKMGTLKTNFNIATPVATSSVRGTEKEISYGSSTGMKVKVFESTVRVHNKSGVDRSAQTNSGFSQKSGSPRPESPVSDTKSRALAKTGSEGFSKEEIESANNSTDSNPRDIEDQMESLFMGKGSTKIKFNIVWP